jgi:AMMECR1 domain-containing protein
MPLISRRDLISAGVTAGASALLPGQLFSLSSKLADSTVQFAPVIADGQMESVEKASYSNVEQKEILNLARNALAKLFEGKTLSDLQSDADRLGIPSAERVNITLRHAGRIRGSMSAPGTNLGRQVIESVSRAAMDHRYDGPLSRWELSGTSLEVWIQTGSSEITPEARFGKNVLLLGVEGLEVEGRGKSAYYEPSVAITSKYKTDIALFEALCKKARLEKDAWRQPDVSMRSTQWLCLRSVNNAHFFGREPDAEAKLPIPINSCIAESASYVIRNQNVNGGTAYLYDPIADLFVGKKSNPIRAAGCLFALSQILQSNHYLAGEGIFKTCTVQMAQGLLNRTSLTGDGRRIVEGEKGGELLEEEEKDGELPEKGERGGDPLEEEEKDGELPAVGATSLLAAALSAGVLRKEFAQEYQQLYRSVASAQKPNGRFVTRFGETEESERAANYYSGETLLVLALEAERGNKEALEMCRRAFQPYVLHFRTAPTSAFVGWHVNVWSRVALLTGDHAYADFAFEQIDWLLKMQIKSHRDLRWVGGFSEADAAPRCSSVVFLEATVRALILAIKTGDTERIKEYTECIRLGLRFCRLLRLEETPSTLLGNPMRCKGGVAFSLTDRRVRCDMVQHFITLCLVVEQTKNYLQ